MPGNGRSHEARRRCQHLRIDLVQTLNIEGYSMRKVGPFAVISAALVAGGSPASGGPPPTPFTEVNAIVLVDVSGSMLEELDASQPGHPKNMLAMQKSIEWIKTTAQTYASQNKPVEWSLWAFSASYPNGYVKVVDFVGTPDYLLKALGDGGTPDPVFTGMTINDRTPLAGAACAVASTLIGDRDVNGQLLANQSVVGHEVDKTGVRRLVYITTDGLENNTPSSSECYGEITSEKAYAEYEPNSWQYKLRNKLLTGCVTNTSTDDSKLVMDVNLFFGGFYKSLSAIGAEQLGASHGGVRVYSSASEVKQAIALYQGLAKSSGGKFVTTSVDANHQLTSRKPGDVDYSGCVDMADYTEWTQWYGQTCTMDHPHCYWADLNGDGKVDDSDYMILDAYWEGAC